MNRKPQTIALIAGCILLIGAISYSVFQSNKVYDTYGQKIFIGDYDQCINCGILEVDERPPRDSIQSYSQERIVRLAQNNPCYLPLIQDPSYWSPEYDSTKHIYYRDLYNATLSGTPHLPDSLLFARRYLVGDFMVLNADSSIRGSEEFYPRIEELFDWLPYQSQWMEEHMRYPLYQSDEVIDRLKDSITHYVNHNHPVFTAESQINFFNKVWRFYGRPIKKTYSFAGNAVYASGQRLCMCEAYWDTLHWVGSVAVSSKKHGIQTINEPDSTETTTTYDHFPLGRMRNYYGALYTISSKHWEYRRSYDSLDRVHDTLMGGGHNRVVRYKGKIELPNFLTMHPSTSYPEAMMDNGIHEVSLRQIPRNMLGTCNSVGCVRVSDYIAKYLRWWVPQDCNFFVAYQPHRYHYRTWDVDIKDLYPIHSQEDGDAFREWVNNEYPYYAKHVQLGRTGDYKNGYIQQAYFELGDEYEQSNP